MSNAAKPDFVIDIFLQPGEFYFGDHESRIKTILGSCVAITMWHPRLKIGGMCHYLLPERQKDANQSEFDGRYADEAMLLFLHELIKSGTKPSDYEVKMFGGGDQFPTHSQFSQSSVPGKNIDIGINLLKLHGFKLKAKHLGGIGYRNIIFDVWSGHIWMRHVDTQAQGKKHAKHKKN
ncbi:MAG: chemotaxis protein CheD [Methylococcaceae bacterium]|jgi:chemotaxis protein CheD